jgi:hypothetical protein
MKTYFFSRGGFNKIAFSITGVILHSIGYSRVQGEKLYAPSPEEFVLSKMNLFRQYKNFYSPIFNRFEAIVKIPGRPE